MKESFLIEQIMVVGESKKFVSALIIPAEEALKAVVVIDAIYRSANNDGAWVSLMKNWELRMKNDWENLI